MPTEFVKFENKYTLDTLCNSLVDDENKNYQELRTISSFKRAAATFKQVWGHLEIGVYCPARTCTQPPALKDTFERFKKPAIKEL